MTGSFSNIKRGIKRIIKKIIILIWKLIYNSIFKLIPVRDKYIMFDSYLGRSYSCNPKAIYEYIKENDDFLGYKFIWTYRKNSYKKVDDSVMVRYRSLKYFFYLSKSKYWIFNSKLSSDLYKKKSQIYVQTWHGTPLKKLAKDIEIGDDKTFYRSEVSKEDMVKTYERDALIYDYLISPNSFSTEKFQSAFGVKKEKILEIGYPRNDVLFLADEKKSEEIKKRLNLPLDKKVILYAPTWRDDTYNSKGYLYKPEADFKKWKERLSEEWVLIYKPHYLIVNDINKEELGDFIYIASNEEDINDLYIVSDLLVTDYSSVFFDYGVLKRPILFYMYDLEDYKENLRGFYLDVFKDLPGPIIKEEDKLLQIIYNTTEIHDDFIDRYKEFYNRFCGLEDGNSSKRLVDRVFNRDYYVEYDKSIKKNL